MRNEVDVASMLRRITAGLTLVFSLTAVVRYPVALSTRNKELELVA